jgi:hypothetical protein
VLGIKTFKNISQPNFTVKRGSVADEAKVSIAYHYKTRIIKSKAIPVTGRAGL